MKTTIYFILFLTTISFFSQSYISAESVEYDVSNNRWLVSNGNRIIADDGNGNLTYFGTGSATHGMEIIANTLFAVDNSDIVAYDLTTQNEVMRFNYPGASFMNGLTNNGSDTLYITDFSARKIYSLNISDLNNPINTELITNTSTTPNGIIYDIDNNRLVYISWGSNAQIRAVDLTTNAITVLTTTNLGNLDGIVKDTNGDFYVSSWSPNRITKFNNDFSESSIVTTPNLSNAADIGYDVTNNIFGIPMGNNVIFVKNTTLSIQNELIDRSFKISNNPVNENSLVIFDLENKSNVNLELFDSTSKRINQLIINEELIGKQEISLAKLNLSSGLYIIKLTVNSTVLSKKLIVN